MFALGALLMAVALSLAPDHWKFSASIRRQLHLGQRLELVWPMLGPEEKKLLRALLGLAIEAEGQK